MLCFKYIIYSYVKLIYNVTWLYVEVYIMLGALHHKSSPRNRHAHLMSMSSCFLTFFCTNEHVFMFLNFFSLCTEVISMGWLAWACWTRWRKKEKKEKEAKGKSHSAMAEQKKRNWLKQSQDKFGLHLL